MSTFISPALYAERTFRLQQNWHTVEKKWKKHLFYGTVAERSCKPEETMHTGSKGLMGPPHFRIFGVLQTTHVTKRKVCIRD